MTFDRYHLAAKLSEAVNEVRRAEVATRPELKHTRWLWLKNWSNLSATQRSELHRLMRPSAGQLLGHGIREGQAMIATLRHKLIRVPARLIHHAGALTLRLPPGYQLCGFVPMQGVGATENTWSCCTVRMWACESMEPIRWTPTGLFAVSSGLLSVRPCRRAWGW